LITYASFYDLDVPATMVMGSVQDNGSISAFWTIWPGGERYGHESRDDVVWLYNHHSLYLGENSYNDQSIYHFKRIVSPAAALHQP